MHILRRPATADTASANTPPPAASDAAPAKGPATGEGLLGRLKALLPKQPPPAPPLPEFRPPRGGALAALRAPAASPEQRDARARRLHDHQLPGSDLALAAYLAARAVDDRAVDEEDVPRLRAASLSLAETRQRLPHGRGNVRGDLQATEGRNYGRAVASRALAKKLYDDIPERFGGKGTFVTAAAATTYGVGNCGEYANVAVLLHTDKLQWGEEAHRVEHRGSDHSWVESRPGGDDDREHTVVIDGWCEGPPILATDGAFTRSTEDIQDLVHLRAETPRNGVRNRLESLERDARTRYGEEGLRELIPRKAWIPWSYGHASTPVIDDDFSARVRPRLDAGGLAAEITAAGAARALGQPLHTLKTDVPRILDVARQILP